MRVVLESLRKDRTQLSFSKLLPSPLEDLEKEEMLALIKREGSDSLPVRRFEASAWLSSFSFPSSASSSFCSPSGWLIKGFLRLITVEQSGYSFEKGGQ